MVSHRLPHRPVRAVFPHTVLPVTASCRSVIRRCHVYTISDHCVSIVFPHDGPVTVSAPSLLPGSGRPRSPAFYQYYEQTKTPDGLLRTLPLSVEHGYLSCFLCSLHLAGKRQLGGLVVDTRWRPLRYWSQDLVGSLMFPGNPLVPLPCSLTPVGPTSLTITGLRCCPRPHNNEGSSNTFISRLNHTALTLAVYASCRHC